MDFTVPDEVPPVELVLALHRLRAEGTLPARHLMPDLARRFWAIEIFGSADSTTFTPVTSVTGLGEEVLVAYGPVDVRDIVTKYPFREDNHYDDGWQQTIVRDVTGRLVHDPSRKWLGVVKALRPTPTGFQMDMEWFDREEEL